MLLFLGGVILGAMCGVVGIFIGWSMAMEAFKTKVVEIKDELNQQTKN